MATALKNTPILSTRIQNHPRVRLILISVCLHAATLLPLVSAQGALAEDSEKEMYADEIRDANTASAAVTLLRSGGYWCDGERRGFYRAVVLAGGFEEVYHHLYVQQFEIQEKTRKLALVRTIPIKETMDLDLVVEDVKLRPDGEELCAGIVIEGAARRRTESGMNGEHFLIRVAQRGSYTARFERVPDRMP